MEYADILIDSTSISLDRLFLYKIPEGLKLAKGDLVLVPFGPRKVKGFVFCVHAGLPPGEEVDAAKIRPVSRLLQTGVLTDRQFQLVDFLKRKYLATSMEAIRLLLPGGLLQGKGHKIKRVLVASSAPFKSDNHAKRYAAIRQAVAKEPMTRAQAMALGFSGSSLNTMVKHGYLLLEEVVDERFSSKDYAASPAKQLNPGQAKALKTICQGDRRVWLLHGVTGSGKTEVFLHLVAQSLERGEDAVILVPEIALTPQMIERVKGRFGRAVTVYHSRLGEGERFDEWMRVKQGHVKIAIGARSALFLPFAKLKLVVVDEEHEMSYKSETNPKYLTREVAEFMMTQNQGKLVLASATPSLEAYGKARAGDYGLVELKDRAGGGKLPAIHVVDMRKELKAGNRHILSRALDGALEANLAQGRQAILFLNRRGLSGFVSCRACGYVYRCPHCAVSLTKHQGNRLVCHHCGYGSYQREACPECGSHLVKEFGIGTQEVERQIKLRFPKARVLRMDKDTTRGKHDFDRVYEAIRDEKADILIGTQMVAKGLDFPGVTLVGILAADLTLNLPDIRAYEKTFQLVSQVAGRAGRGDDLGQVYLQTYQPEAYPIVKAAQGDYEGFYELELASRRALAYPPVGQLFALVLSHQEEAKVIQASQAVAAQLKELIQGRNLSILGPSPCLLGRLKGWYRQQILIKGSLTDDLAGAIRKLAYQSIAGQGIRLSLDRQPASLM